MRLLDLFCCQGGAGAGYAAAGWEVAGVDLADQPRYPFPFTRGDVLALDAGWIAENFDAVHASPPCQAHTLCQRIRGREHPALIPATRELLQATGLPYVIENVEDARPELVDPVTLCGVAFGLHTYRHRLFETNWDLTDPPHVPHDRATVKMGRPVRPGDFYHAVGNFSGVAYVREDLGVPWMNRDGIRECIPPAYTRHIGAQLAELVPSIV